MKNYDPRNERGERLISDKDLETQWLSNAYARKKKHREYLYELWYDKLDYEYAEKYLENAQGGGFSCTSVRKGNFYGRNFDWTYNRQAEFVIHTQANYGLHATIGVADSITGLSEEYTSKSLFSNMFRIVPFYIVDGINDAGVVMNSNVVPVVQKINEWDETYFPNKVITPNGEVTETLCTMMLIRFVLDNFSSAQEAVEHLKEHTKIYQFEKLFQMGYELHYMIADAEKTYILEFVDGKLVAKEGDKDAGMCMTNFHLHVNTLKDDRTPQEIIFNEDGTVCTPYTAHSEGKRPTEVNGIENHGSGLERYNIFAKNISGVSDEASMQELMKSLFYTKSYTIGRENEEDDEYDSERWFTEFVGDYSKSQVVEIPHKDIIVDDFDDLKLVSDWAYQHLFLPRTRDDGATWHTTHSVVYDIENRSIKMMFQEDAENPIEFQI